MTEKSRTEMDAALRQIDNSIFPHGHSVYDYALWNVEKTAEFDLWRDRLPDPFKWALPFF